MALNTAFVRDMEEYVQENPSADLSSCMEEYRLRMDEIGASRFGAAGAPVSSPGGYNYTPTSDYNALNIAFMPGSSPPLCILSISAMDQFREVHLSHEEIRLADMASADFDEIEEKG